VALGPGCLALSSPGPDSGYDPGMTGVTGAPLDAAHVEFIQSGVSVIVGTRDAAMVPDAVRGCGCRVSRDRRRITVFVDRERAASLLDDLAENRAIAVVFSQPSTHRTIQLKGTDAAPVRAQASDRRLVAAHREAWISDLVGIGYSRAFAEALWGRPPEALTAVAFTPIAAFQQTPGPAAGQPLGR
jgi:hypothetical protein